MSDLEIIGKADQAKGKVKETAGKLYNDKSTEAEGKLDQAAEKLKEKTCELAGNIKKELNDNKY